MPSAVRHLTPAESERLQGLPDDYTQIPWRSQNGAPDSPRYKAPGNSMAVNVMEWIGGRIEKVEQHQFSALRPTRQQGIHMHKKIR
ncbi:DNA cytosine methyltransferase [Gemmobacter nectariphilus]|uniref:DNA cytosine methyltransferase n=1 Tax=Gemmobacter nectariphilus TaxID=220343 RepID=UPI003CCBB8FD